MFYDPRKNDHGLPHNPLNALVVPRPIAWISSLSRAGVVNLAPYSFFNLVSYQPPYLMFASTDPKDSRRNIEETGEFVVNMATWSLREEVNYTSIMTEPTMSEAELAGIDMIPSHVVRPPRVAQSPVALECRYAKTVALDDYDGTPAPSAMIIGQIVGVYIDDAVIVNGRVDLAEQALSRLGYLDFGVISTVVTMPRPERDTPPPGAGLLSDPH
jgi:flavin reductase (DIM6/NTAB) family NADH-FMN oxidoreductase RutF